VDRYNDPVENSEKSDEACQEPEDKAVIQPFSLYGIEKRNQGEPGQKFQIKIREGEDKENSREETQEEILFFHGLHHKQSEGNFQGAPSVLGEIGSE
jgi:hypothetical protein